MNENEYSVSVSLNGHQYPFRFGSQAYIFHTGILNSLYDDHGIDVLLRYISFVHQCYLSDDDRTPLGSLADYVAENWAVVRKKPCQEVLCEFYASIF